MRDPVRALGRAYGAHPLHLLSLLACFALTGYVVDQLGGDPSLPRIVVWFAGAVIAHDLVAFPVYAFVDRAANRALTRRPRARVPLLNYVRVPAAGGALLLIVYLPGIIRQGGSTYRAATGQTQQPFLLRWLLLSAALFAVSAIVYAIRRLTTRRPPP
jgi:hypothetical protein